MLIINSRLSVPEHELQFTGLRSSGAGGQHVNKVSTAVQLKFDIAASSLPVFIKQRLLGMKDRRISRDGMLTIKAQEFRSRSRNREAALERLKEMIEQATQVRKKRIATRPGKAAKQRRAKAKQQRGDLKKLRSKPRYGE